MITGLRVNSLIYHLILGWGRGWLQAVLGIHHSLTSSSNSIRGLVLCGMLVAVPTQVKPRFSASSFGREGLAPLAASQDLTSSIPGPFFARRRLAPARTAKLKDAVGLLKVFIKGDAWRAKRLSCRCTGSRRRFKTTTDKYSARAKLSSIAFASRLVERNRKGMEFSS